MKKELDELLCRRYPLIFAERGLPMNETCMCWGFACEDGWFDLIDALCERLQFWTDRNGAPQVVASQVKEKYGELCFYPRGAASDMQSGMILMAEAMSARICEQCGRPGRTLVNGYWFMTRCVEHAPEGAITQEAYFARRAGNDS
jgi:hypothetical protein